MFEALIEAGLVKQKRYENGLSVFKYARKVFYDALWNTDPLLLEARGMVLDDAGNKIIWPFTKVFNRFENCTDLPANTKIVAPRKVNGFMASVTRYHDEIIISTTGSLDSDFVGYAREMLEGVDLNLVYEGYTWLFEIVHPADPHIVEEEIGAYLIGVRRHNGGAMMDEGVLDAWAGTMGCKRPEWIRCNFGQICELLKIVKHEGFMVRLDEPGQPTMMKLKSPHYLTKKWLMRMGAKRTPEMFNNTQKFKEGIDEEFYGVVDWIVSTCSLEYWNTLKDTERREIIEDYFGGCHENVVSGEGTTGQREEYTGCHDGSCLACSTL
jgi:hypothetical protein